MIIAEERNKLGMRALLVYRSLNPEGTGRKIMDKMKKELEDNDVEVVTANNSFDADMLIYADPMFQALILDWDVEDNKTHNPAKRIIDTLRSRNTKMPIFLFGDTESALIFLWSTCVRSTTFCGLSKTLPILSPDVW